MAALCVALGASADRAAVSTLAPHGDVVTAAVSHTGLLPARHQVPRATSEQVLPGVTAVLPGAAACVLLVLLAGRQADPAPAAVRQIASRHRGRSPPARS